MIEHAGDLSGRDLNAIVRQGQLIEFSERQVRSLLQPLAQSLLVLVENLLMASATRVRQRLKALLGTSQRQTTRGRRWRDSKSFCDLGMSAFTVEVGIDNALAKVN